MNESKATRYQRLRRRARTASVASAILMLAAIALTPAAAFIRGMALGAAEGLSGPGGAAVALVVFVVIVVTVCEIATLPAAAYLARHVEPAYGQHTPSGDQVLAEQLHAAAVVVPGAIAAAAAVHTAMVVAGSWWWVAAGPLMALLLAAALRFAPVLFASLGKIQPFSREALARRLSDLASRANVPVAGIDEWVVDETAPATAFVTGVGRGRRILVSSEIARRWPDDEVAVVVAHELAHHAYHDLWRTFALHVSVLWASLFASHLAALWLSGALVIEGPRDLAALPLIALVTASLWILVTPLLNAQSRRQEKRADTFALVMTNGADAFGSAVTRLGARHLSEERPSRLTRWLYHRHPSVTERLALAERFRTLRDYPAESGARR